MSFNIQNIALLFAVIITMTILPAYTYANDRMAGSTKGHKERNTKKNITAATADLFTLESFGTLDSLNAQSLGTDIWARSDTDTLRIFMAALPAEHKLRPFYQLQRQLLLTSAPVASSIRDYAPPEQQQDDILALRFQTLLRMGLIEDAATLYKMLPLSPVTKRQFENGLAALLFNSDTALACLEFQAHDISARYEDKWVESLASLCQKSYFDKSTTKMSPKSDVKEWSEKSLIEKAFLFTQTPDKIQKNLLKNNKNIQESSPAPLDIAILLSAEALKTESKLRFAAYAYHIGMYSTENLEDLFNDIGTKSDDKRIKLYQQIVHSAHESKDLDVFTTALIKDNSNYEYNLLRPLSPLLEHIPLKTFIKMRDEKQAHLLFQLAAEENISYTEKWINTFFSLYEDRTLPEKLEKSIIFYILSTEQTSEKTKLILGKTSLKENIRKNIYNYNKIYYEKLDTAAYLFNIDPKMSYENTNPLTSVYGYVMHYGSKQNRSESAVKTIKQNRELGLVVMLGSIAYRDDKTKNISQDALWATAKTFDDVGLKHFAKVLVREALAY